MNVYERIVLFLIRKKHGLKLYQNFRFKNQSDKYNYYCIGKCSVIKHVVYNEHCIEVKDSKVKYNWLLNNDCEIEKL